MLSWRNEQRNRATPTVKGALATSTTVPGTWYVSTPPMFYSLIRTDVLTYLLAAAGTNYSTAVKVNLIWLVGYAIRRQLADYYTRWALLGWGCGKPTAEVSLLEPWGGVLHVHSTCSGNNIPR